MKTTAITVQKKSGRANLGTVFFSDSKNESSLSDFTPYIKNAEDVEVLLRNANLLRKNQPIEVCGYNITDILAKAASVEESVKEQGGKPYGALSAEHPVIVSFPSEVLWLSAKRGNAIGKMETYLQENLPETSAAATDEEARELALKLRELAHLGSENYNFWSGMKTTRHKGHTLAKIFMEAGFLHAKRARATFYAPQVPVISGPKWSRSPLENHNYNRSYGVLFEAITNAGEKPPKLLYVVDMTSEVFGHDQGTMLDDIYRNVRMGLEENLFDGLFVSVRGLSRIATSPGRVRTVIAMARRLNDIAEQNLVPAYYSRFGLVGLRTMDEGGAFSSFTLNLSIEDIMQDPAPPKSPDLLYGKVIDIEKGEFYIKNQVEEAIGTPLALSPVVGVRNIPTPQELGSNRAYRLRFSKPYNLAAMNYQAQRWREEIANGETVPGQEYLQRFRQDSYDKWGLPPTR